MFPFQAMDNFPSKCPYADCRAKLHQDCILGVIPRAEVPLVNVILRCRKCRKTIGFGMPAVVVQKFIESLPEGKGLLANRRSIPREQAGPTTAREESELADLLASCPQKLIQELRVMEENDEFFGLYDDEDDD